MNLRIIRKVLENKRVRYNIIKKGMLLSLTWAIFVLLDYYYLFYLLLFIIIIIFIIIIYYYIIIIYY